MISLRVSINYIRACNNNISRTMSIYELYNFVTSALFPTQQETNHSADMEPEESEGMTTIARINRLALLLAESVYERRYQDNICLFYSSLILEYPRAKATKIRPHFLHQPSIYTPLISFNISLGVRVQSKKINCQLDLSIMFPSDLSHQMPHFYLKNPNYEFFKPVSKFTKIVSQNENYPYEAIFGGLMVVLPSHSEQRWNWTPSLYYKQQNIVNMVRFIHKILLPDFFPFAKRKYQKNNVINEKAETVKYFIEQQMLVPNSEQVIPLLQNIQSTHALTIGIQNELSVLKIQLEGLKKYIKESELVDIKDCLPKPTDNRSEFILDSVCSIEALNDTQRLLEDKLTCEEINFNQFKTFISLTSNQKFEKMALLKQLENIQ